jgi:hypothetical protein
MTSLGEGLCAFLGVIGVRLIIFGLPMLIGHLIANGWKRTRTGESPTEGDSGSTPSQ